MRSRIAQFTLVRSRGPVAVGLLGLAILGCGGESRRGSEVVGKVVYKDQPVTRGTITFVPLEGKEGSPAMGLIQPDGSYTLQTATPGDGVAPGDYVVLVNGQDPSAPPPPMPLPGVKEAEAPKKTEPAPIPERYLNADQSGIKVTVQSGRNDIPIELK